MSVITIQIGQCGNQIGLEYFKTLAQDVGIGTTTAAHDRKYSELSTERFFYKDSEGELVARAILIDTEQKVVNHVVEEPCKNKKWHYSKSSSYTQRQGAGNNWAYGYYSHGGTAMSDILEIIRHHAESCDWLGGFLPILSLGGGTGSGLGTKVTEVLKEYYPSTPLINVAVWPFSSGEIAVQSYNTLLSLSHLQDVSDCVILINNDSLYHIASKRWGLKNSSFNHLNSIASQQLACLFQPARNHSGSLVHLGDIAGSLACHAQYKFITLKLVPQEAPEAVAFSSVSWPSLMVSLKRMVLYQSVIDEGMNDRSKISPHPVSISNLLVARGQDLQYLNPDPLNHPSLTYVPWVPLSDRLHVWTSCHKFLGLGKVACLASNGQTCIPLLEATIEKAWRRFAESAYLHQYEKHGLEAEDLMENFLRIEQTLESYKQLWSKPC